MKKTSLRQIVFLVTLISLSASATELFWSQNGTAQGGAGQWNTVIGSTTNLWGTAAAGPFTLSWTNANNDDANFGSTAGGVTIQSTGVTVKNLSAVSGYAFHGSTSSTLTFAAGATVSVT